MKARTMLPTRVLEAATQIHLSLVETNFYAEECQVIVNDLDVIEYIGTELLPGYFKTGEALIEEDQFEHFLRGVITFTVFESLKSKGIIDSIDVDGEEIHFMPNSVKEKLAANIDISTKNAA